MKASPSKLKALASCPRWVPDYRERDENMKEAAEEGTRFHKLCERVTEEQKPEDWEDVARLSDPHLGSLVAEALVPVRNIVMGNSLKVFTGTSNVVPVGFFKNEVEMESKVTGRQRMDLLARPTREQAVIVDYKSNRTEPDVRLQMEAYAHTLFTAHPEITDILLMVPTPRVFGDDYQQDVTRERDFARIDREIKEIVRRMADPFFPGRPGQHCCVCAGNGRCPYQASSLREVASDPEIAIVSRRQIIDPAEPEDRGKRKELTSWLKKFCEACDQQDKEWAIQNPGVELPGWKISMSPGRKSLDPERRLETAKLVESVLMVGGDDLLACATVDIKSLTQFVKARDGLSDEEAKALVTETLDGVMKRGAAFPVMRKIISRKELTT